MTKTYEVINEVFPGPGSDIERILTLRQIDCEYPDEFELQVKWGDRIYNRIELGDTVEIEP